MSNLKIYGIARTRAFRALWMAKELGLDYEHDPVEIGDAGARMPEFLAINPNDPHLYPDESYPRMIDRAAENAYSFPYLLDEGQRVAKAYGATCTFHVFVLDRERHLRYQGRFDDSRLVAKVTSHDLRNALDDVLAGRGVRVSTTRPFGCSLDFV